MTKIEELLDQHSEAMSIRNKRPHLESLLALWRGTTGALEFSHGHSSSTGFLMNQ
jgi:hypothetical protein